VSTDPLRKFAFRECHHCGAWLTGDERHDQPGSAKYCKECQSRGIDAGLEQFLSPCAEVHDERVGLLERDLEYLGTVRQEHEWVTREWRLL